MSKGTVLVVASAADKLELQSGKVIPIGVYLNELAIPAMAVIDAGYNIVLATPTGAKPVLDERSRRPSHFDDSEEALRKALEFFDSRPAMRQPRSLRAVVAEGIDKYVGVFVPGGHAPITDLSQDAEFGLILRHFHGKAKPTALLCHGPIALIASVPEPKAFRDAMEAGNIDAAKAAAKGWQYAGYTMTIFSNQEEQIVEDQIFHGKLKFRVGDALEAAGGILASNTNPFDPKVTRDHELITGQNPRSDRGLADAFVEALNE